MRTAATDPTGRTPEELEHEVNEQRQRMAHTIDALQEKISVGGLVDQVLDAVRTHGGDVGESFGRRVKNNPLPLVLTGIGLAWLMSTDGTGARRQDDDYDDDYDDEYDDDDGHGYYPTARARGYSADASYIAHEHAPYGITDSASGGASSSSSDAPTGNTTNHGDRSGSAGAKAEAGAAKLARSGRDALERSKDAARTGQDKVQAGVHKAREQLDEGRDAASRRAAELRDDIRDHSIAARRRTRQLARRSRRGLENLFEEQPLVVGALALAAGAALGGALPRTRTEDRLMGEPSDALAEAARETAREETPKVRAVADAAMGEGQRVINDLAGKADQNTPSGQEIVEKTEEALRSAAERIADSAKDEAKNQDLGGSVRSR